MSSDVEWRDSYGELKLPFETVRSRLRLGMDKLRQKLKRGEP